MAAVRIENDAWTDPRYELLAELVGLGDGDFARVRCARVWSYCTDRNEDVLAESVLDVLGKHKGFARAMVESGLAEETKRGFRVRGARGRIEWLASKRNNASKGGKAKASKRLASASDVADKKIATASEAPSSRSADCLPSGSGSGSAPAKAKAKREEHLPSVGGEPAPAAPPKSKASRWRRFPADFQPGPEHIALAAELCVDLALELPKLRDHEFRDPHSDPAAVMRTWIRNAAKFAPANRNGASRRGPAPVSSNAEFEEMIREQRGSHA